MMVVYACNQVGYLSIRIRGKCGEDCTQAMKRDEILLISILIDGGLVVR